MTIDWKTVVRTDRPPDARAVAASHSRVGWVAEEITEPAVVALIRELQRLRSTDFVQVARFRPTVHDDTLSWFVSRNRPYEWDFFRHLLGHRATRTVLPDLGIPDPLREVPGLTAVRLHALDGELGAEINAGSVYTRYDGTFWEAKRLGFEFLRGLVGDRPADFAAYFTSEAWTSWFSAPIPTDRTWVIIDRGAARVLVICLTDSD
ncbi:hypothetical protein [Plantactinospora sonchi]|uniref:Uncharacterized protein n=1 Tax=Plantactinospora sonchi TaxID=1544735 RepID=A0ABU7S0L7_9ACTN